MVGLRQVPERLVDEHARQDGVEHDRVLPSLDLGGVEESHRFLRDLPRVFLQAHDKREITQAAEAYAVLLNVGAVAGLGVEPEIDVDALLVKVRAFGVRVDHAPPSIRVADGG